MVLKAMMRKIGFSKTLKKWQNTFCPFINHTLKTWKKTMNTKKIVPVKSRCSSHTKSCTLSFVVGSYELSLILYFTGTELVPIIFDRF